MRAKVYAVLRQLGFDAVRGGLSPEDGVLLEAARCFGTLAETEAWSDVQEELMASPGTRPVSADAARLNATLAELQQGAAAILERQRALDSTIGAGAETEREALLKSVKLLRDGPQAAVAERKGAVLEALFAELDLDRSGHLNQVMQRLSPHLPQLIPQPLLAPPPNPSTLRPGRIRRGIVAPWLPLVIARGPSRHVRRD